MKREELDDVLFGGDMLSMPTDKVRELAMSLAATAELIEQCEDRLSALKEKARRLENQEIPQAMAEMGVTDLSAEWGNVKVVPFWSGSIPPESADAAYDWLDANGLGEYIKRTVEVPVERGNEELLAEVRDALGGAGILYSEKCGVHHQTLQALIKAMAKQGKPVPSDLFRVYTGTKAKIKLT